MPSARDLARRTRSADGLPLPLARDVPKPHHPPGRIREATQEKGGAQTKKGGSGSGTASRGHWNNHFDDDVHHWKGNVPGRDHYTPYRMAPPASRDGRFTAHSIPNSACRDT